MASITCINNKNGRYNVTEGNLYEIIRQEDGYVFVVNDNNVTARYAHNLFTEVEELVEDAQPVQVVRRGRPPVQVVRPVAQVQEVAPPPPPPLTEAEMIASFRRTGRNGWSIQQPNREVIHFTTGLSAHDSMISCGVLQLSGLDSVYANLMAIPIFQGPDNFNLAVAIYKEIINSFIMNDISSCAMVIMSTTVDEDEANKRIIDAALDEIATASERVENPNSGNTICMWTYYTED